MKTKQQFFSDFVVSVIFWAKACTTQYEFIVVNGHTMTLVFYKGSVATVSRWYG